ncbi:hypothetical protein SAMN02745131_00117 [Flavisolibacter ginsengisoli DSM 18119]|jgi:hypothetical protein|uniref:Uncharacterized protein n=1 Tax=Flavisolibacter ginsengisoli DSM 18119 TaxID=1121884 RepID=A0A1M4SH97_9BACT|nr:hypothetical protein SAMN02745131_00117 [Flavisolibacter ginsengisoli DSM 18119]
MTCWFQSTNGCAITNLLNRLHSYKINNLIKFDDKLPYGVKVIDQTEF